MSHYFRVRAFVDGNPVEEICLGGLVEGAMTAFSKLDCGTGEPNSEYPIEVAMVHRIQFGETAPEYVDVTGSLESSWKRASFEDTLKFYAAPGKVEDASK